MNHITREYAGKKIKIFLNVSPLIIVKFLLWPFKVSSLYLLTDQGFESPSHGVDIFGFQS